MAVVSYELDDGSVVRFECEPGPGFQAAGADEVVGRLRDAVGPAVRAAKAVLEQVRDVGPEEISVSFGVKVTGTANWVVAKAATEGSFEVTLTWKGDR
jgi:hypothetical protein